MKETKRKKTVRAAAVEAEVQEKAPIQEKQVETPEETRQEPVAEAEQTPDAQKVCEFKMVAYTGGPMRIEGFDEPVVVSVDGLDVGKGKVPVLYSHEVCNAIGHTVTIEKNGVEVVAEGIFSRSGSVSQDVAGAGKLGFPWQASIGGEVAEDHYVEEGKSEVVNGAEVVGPVTVVDRMILKEISFVEFGADDKTAVVVAHAAPCLRRLNATSPAVKTCKCEGSDMSIEKIRSEYATEMRRIQKINEIGRRENPTLEAKAIEEGWSAERFELEMLRAARPKAVSAAIPADENEKVLEAAALMAAGTGISRLEANYSEKVLEAAEKRRRLGLREFIRAASGRHDLGDFRMDSRGWLRAAFSSASISGILSNVANKTLLEGYNYCEQTWRDCVKIASVNDFKQHERYRLSATGFEKVPRGGEIKHGTISEQKFTQQAETWGIMFGISRQMLIDDDLGALADIPRQIGVQAGEAIAAAVWKLLLSNPTGSDSKTFFHADHNNLVTGTDYALGADALEYVHTKFMAQTKPDGHPLGLQPAVLLVPSSLEITALRLMNSQQLIELTSKAKPVTNVLAGRYKIASSSYLCNSSYSGYSATAWYLLADPNRCPALEVAFLNGVDKPTIEEADVDFNMLGIQFRGFIDFGVKEQDWRGAVKATGAN